MGVIIEIIRHAGIAWDYNENHTVLWSRSVISASLALHLMLSLMTRVVAGVIFPLAMGT